MSRSNMTPDARSGVASVCGLAVLFSVMAAYALNAQEAGQDKQQEHIKTITTEQTSQTPDENAVQTRQQASTSPDDKPVIVIPEPEHDFGEIWVGEELSYTFQVKNDGKGVLKLINVKPSCGCTLAKDYDREIPPGGTGKIPITINSKRLHGKFNKSVSVTSNDEQNNRLTLKISGNCKHYVEVQPRTSINFGTIKMHEEKSDSVKIVNNSDTPLELTMADRAVKDAFSTELKETIPGKEYELTIKASPPYQEGRNRATLAIQTNIPQEPQLRISAYVNILERLEVLPKQLPITRPAPEESARTMTLTNYGNSPVHLVEATVNDEKLKVETEEYEAGKKYKITLKVPADYAPPQAGKFVTLKLDDAEKPSITIPIRGPRPNPAQLVGKPAPQVELTTMGGTTINTASVQDSAVVLFFYASWCPHCKRSLPNVEKIYQDYKDQNVRIVAVNLDDPEDRNPRRRFTREQALEKLKEGGVTFDVAFDPQRKVGTPFMATSFPTTYVLDKKGTVVNHVRGAIVGANVSRLNDVIKQALPGQQKSTVSATGGSSTGTH